MGLAKPHAPKGARWRFRGWPGLITGSIGLGKRACAVMCLSGGAEVLTGRPSGLSRRLRARSRFAAACHSVQHWVLATWYLPA